MGVKVATTCLQWSQPIVHHSSCYLQTLASTVSSPSSARRNRSDGGALTSRCVHTLGRPGLLGIPLAKFQRSRSCCGINPRIQTIRRACSANLDGFSDEEFSKQIQDLALRFQISAENSIDANAEGMESVSDSGVGEFNSADCSVQNQMQITPPQLASSELPWPEIHGEPEIIADDIERKANSVDFPLSLRILKRKMQWHEGIREARESAYCSVKKAFSSMVFMIRELHCYSLKLREILFYEDLQGILNRVEKEMHASFVWLFQQVFSHTPTLMVYVMILLANFTVYSMGNNSAIAASSFSGPSLTQTVEEVVQLDNRKHQKFDSSTIKTFSASTFNGKTTFIGGNGGGGGKVRPIASGTDGDGFNRSINYSTVIPDGASQLSSIGTSTEEESISGETIKEEELSRWKSILEEASQMQSAVRNEAIDEDVMRRFVSPVTAKIEADDYPEYFRTELLYQTGLSQDPNNPLLLSNYAQFLYLVAHDYDR